MVMIGFGFGFGGATSVFFGGNALGAVAFEGVAVFGEVAAFEGVGDFEEAVGNFLEPTLLSGDFAFVCTFAEGVFVAGAPLLAGELLDATGLFPCGVLELVVGLLRGDPFWGSIFSGSFSKSLGSNSVGPLEVFSSIGIVLLLDRVSTCLNASEGSTVEEDLFFSKEGRFSEDLDMPSDVFELTDLSFTLVKDNFLWGVGLESLGPVLEVPFTLDIEKS